MIHIQLEGLPPSVNKAYYEQVARKGKRLVPVRTLSKEGRAYKRQTTAAIAMNYGPQLVGIKKDEPYALSIKLQFPELANSGWPKRTKARYKKLDVSNRIKLLEDALVDALGIDDSQFFMVTATKAAGPEATLIWIWECDENANAR